MIITIELEFQTGFQTGIRLGIRLVSDWYQTGHRPLLKLTTSKAQSPAAGLGTRTGRRGQDRTGRDGTDGMGRDGTDRVDRSQHSGRQIIKLNPLAPLHGRSDFQ